MEKILAHGIKMQKNSQTRADVFWIFTNFNGVMRIQCPTCSLARKIVSRKFYAMDTFYKSSRPSDSNLTKNWLLGIYCTTKFKSFLEQHFLA